MHCAAYPTEQKTASPAGTKHCPLPVAGLSMPAICKRPFSAAVLFIVLNKNRKAMAHLHNSGKITRA
jgi:hypothetical protein